MFKTGILAETQQQRVLASSRPLRGEILAAKGHLLEEGEALEALSAIETARRTISAIRNSKSSCGTLSGIGCIGRGGGAQAASCGECAGDGRAEKETAHGGRCSASNRAVSIGSVPSAARKAIEVRQKHERRKRQDTWGHACRPSTSRLGSSREVAELIAEAMAAEELLSRKLAANMIQTHKFACGGGTFRKDTGGETRRIRQDRLRA